MITAESIDRVREAADIVEIIGEHVKLRRTGADFRGPCPFHGGKGPNFSVSPRRNAYHCFKCGVSGDVFSFVRERLGLDFAETVKYVAARAGVEVKEDRRTERTADPREPLWEANAAAAAFFRDTLWTEDEAQAAREYLTSRAIDRDAADRFELGYAPRDGARLRAHLNALGFEDERLLAAGVLARSDDRPEPYVRFRGRLMIPIVDVSGRHVGFGGRVIGAGEPKYLNSAESEVFSKGRLLYNHSGARHAARRNDRVLLVEGYFDAIRLALAGVDEVVAPLGTALTEQQAAMLAKLTKNVFLLYDSDEAGTKATFRAGKELLRHGVSARVTSLPDGEDPDTFVAKHGAKGLESQLAHAVDIFERQIMEVQRRGMFEELHKKRVAIDKLLQTLRAVADPLTRDMYVGRLADASGMAREELKREAERPEAREAARAAQPSGGSRANAAAPVVAASPTDTIAYERPVDRKREWDGERRRRFRRQADFWISDPGIPRPLPSAAILQLEKGLLRAVLFGLDQVDAVAERWGADQFRLANYRRIFETLLNDEDRSLASLAERLSAEDVAVLDELVTEPLAPADAHAGPWIQKLDELSLKEERDEINRMLRAPDKPLSAEVRERLIARRDEIRQDMRALRLA